MLSPRLPSRVGGRVECQVGLEVSCPRNLVQVWRVEAFTSHTTLHPHTTGSWAAAAPFQGASLRPAARAGAVAVGGGAGAGRGAGRGGSRALGFLHLPGAHRALGSGGRQLLGSRGRGRGGAALRLDAKQSPDCSGGWSAVSGAARPLESLRLDRRDTDGRSGLSRNSGNAPPRSISRPGPP